MERLGDVAAKIVDRWAWYQAALKDPTQIGKTLLIHDGEPQQGYYRVRPKDGQWEPVAIFYPESSEQIVAYRNGQEIAADTIWTWCCRNPISYEAYEKAMAGGGFDDEPAKSRGIGDNSGEADPFDALTIEFLGEKEMAEEFMKTSATEFIGKPVEAKERADKVAIWCDRIEKIRSKAKALHKVEKQPWLDGGKAVDDKWRPLAHDRDGDTTDVIAKLRAYNAPILKWFKDEEAKRQRRAFEEAEAARRAAAEAAAKARASEGEQSAVDQEAAKIAAEEAAARARQAEKDAEARKVSAGRTGAKMGLRTEKIGVVTDYAKAAAALVNMNHPDMLKEIDRLANAAAKKNFPIDGVEIREQEVVR